MVMALIIGVVLLLLSAALVTASVTEALSVHMAGDAARALNVAEAGLSHAIALALRGDFNWRDGAGADDGGCGTVRFWDGSWIVLRVPGGNCL